MLELCPQDIVCPSCEKSFFPQMSVVRKTFCGEELICSPPGENYKSPDCRVFNFCSDQCLEDFESKLPTCSIVPRWKRLMGKINQVSRASGIAGVKSYHLHKCSK